MTPRRPASLLAVLFATLACVLSPDEPTETEARAAARAQAALLGRMERDVDEALAAIDLVGVCHHPDCPCRELIDELRPGCSVVRAERRARVRDVTERFQRETVPAWARETPLLGAEVTFRLPDEATQLLGRVAPSTPGRRNGAVRAPRSELAHGAWQGALGGRGLYQTAWTRGAARYGDGEYHRGIELHWTRGHGVAQAWITAWVLIDGWRRPAAWPVR
ncbi:MAG: hypothetical protein EPO40_35225 [Myxococcaceae bacterium]|nr:MAG: hypothetical protein EPO40_35225 [Myxococcaceae bacterium]